MREGVLLLAIMGCAAPTPTPVTPKPAASAPATPPAPPATTATCLDTNKPEADRDAACLDACNERHGPSCLAYGDLEAAKEGLTTIWAFDRACSIGEPRGCTDRDKHLAKLRAGCTKDALDVCRELGETLFALEAPTSQHILEAIRVQDMACVGGHSGACVDLGRHYAEDQAIQNLALARKYYEKACDLKEGYGCCGLYQIAPDLLAKKAAWARAEAVKGWCTQPAPNGAIPTPP